MSLHQSPSTFPVPVAPPGALAQMHAEHKARRRSEQTSAVRDFPEVRAEQAIEMTIVFAVLAHYWKRKAECSRITAFLAQKRLGAARFTLEMSAAPGLPRKITVKDIQNAACAEFSIGIIDLLSSRRTADIVLPRQISQYLAKQLTLQSLPEIGRRSGNRDHTTVLHSVRKIAEIIAAGGDMAKRIVALEQSLRHRFKIAGDEQ